MKDGTRFFSIPESFFLETVREEKTNKTAAMIGRCCNDSFKYIYFHIQGATVIDLLVLCLLLLNPPAVLSASENVQLCTEWMHFVRDMRILVRVIHWHHQYISGVRIFRRGIFSLNPKIFGVRFGHSLGVIVPQNGDSINNDNSFVLLGCSFMFLVASLLFCV